MYNGSTSACPVVIDCGSSKTRAGLAVTGRHIRPSVEIPSVVGQRRTNAPPRNCWSELDGFIDSTHAPCFGADAVASVLKGEPLRLAYPVNEGVYTDTDAVGSLLEYVYRECLKIDPRDQPLLLTEPVYNPASIREKATEMLFEELGVPSLNISVKEVAALVGTGWQDGIVVDAGEAMTSVVPISHGCVVTSGIRKLYLGGADLDVQFAERLARRADLRLTTTRDRLKLRRLKESVCYCRSGWHDTDDDFDENRYEAESESPRITLPDGTAIDMADDKWKVPESLFHPHLLGIEGSGIGEMVVESIEDCPIDDKLKLYKKIILAGGTSQFRGFAERLRSEVEHSVKFSRTVSAAGRSHNRNPQVHVEKAHRHPDWAAWIGGSAFASLKDSFEDRWLSKEEYEECGPDAINSKVQISFMPTQLCIVAKSNSSVGVTMPSAHLPPPPPSPWLICPSVLPVFWGMALVSPVLIEIKEEYFRRIGWCQSSSDCNDVQLLWSVVTVSVSALISCFTGPLVGAYSDSLARRRMYFVVNSILAAVPPLWLSLSALKTGVSHMIGYFVLEVLVSLAGVGPEYARFPLLNAYVVDCCPQPQRRMRIYGALMALSLSGLLVFPMLGAEIHSFTIVHLWALLCVGSAIYTVAVLPESHPGARDPTFGSRSRPRPFDWLHLPPRATIVLRTCLEVRLTIAVADSGISQSINSYLQSALGFTALQRALFAACIGISGLLCSTLLLRFLQNECEWKPQRILLLALVCYVSHYLVYAVANSVDVALFGATLAGPAMLGSSAIAALIADYTPSGMAGTAMAANNSVGGIGSAIGPMVFGIFLVWTREHKEGESTPFIVASLIATLAGVLVYFRLPKAIQIYSESTPGMEEMMARERMLNDEYLSEEDEDNG
ncbi:hypothetical protein FOL47_010923 [Perkinsus chesapeaki]|uniref:Major facilitator superfamily (MFS) profile domain-containing protein n=1 Tax=Perkinsus chesapeaki TaxID=330153 RepID=A0A7J6N1E4_PERCH|nr:hypothetical protein FOL47_010923 [Perkinsus chesapeaki]